MTGRPALDAAINGIHDGRCRDGDTHADLDGCRRFYTDHAQLALRAIADSPEVAAALYANVEGCLERCCDFDDGFQEGVARTLQWLREQAGE